MKKSKRVNLKNRQIIIIFFQDNCHIFYHIIKFKLIFSPLKMSKFAWNFPFKFTLIHKPQPKSQSTSETPTSYLKNLVEIPYSTLKLTLELNIILKIIKPRKNLNNFNLSLRVFRLQTIFSKSSARATKKSKKSIIVNFFGEVQFWLNWISQLSLLNRLNFIFFQLI